MIEKLRQWFVDNDGANAGRICMAIGAVGAALIALGVFTVWGTGWGKDLFAPGATLLTVALSAWATTRAVVKWTEQRERDRQAAEYKHREEVYETLSILMLNSITGGMYNRDLDLQLRARAALWASPQTIGQLGAWQERMSKAIKDHGGATNFDTTPAEQAEFQEAFARAVAAMRSDLSSKEENQVTRHEIGKLIFNS